MFAFLRPIAVATAWLALGPACVAEVLRCVDARGSVVYTDQRCPAGSRSVSSVAVPDAPPPAPRLDDGARQAQVDSAERAARLQREMAEAATRQAQRPVPPNGGLTIMGPAPRPSPQEQRWATRSEDRAWVDPWGGYPGGYYPGAGYRPGPVPDQRPTLRHCDAGGCTDTLGNHYDRRGRLDRYPGPGGKTCRPAGSTVICR